MFSLSAITIPVLMDTNTDGNRLLHQWTRLHHYGHIIMPSLAVGTLGLFAYSSLVRYTSNRPQWVSYAVAGVSAVTIVPFTLLMMAQTNDALFALDGSAESVTMGTLSPLIIKWAWLHAARSIFPLIGSVLGFIGVLADRQQ